MTKIKTGDTVRVMSGSTNKGKGKEGKVLKVDNKKGKVLVEGINLVKRHSKPSAQNQTGGIIEKEAPIDISNVMYVHKGKPTRIGFKVTEDGKKVRVAKSTGDVID
ncbi:MAG: 50S ribosomal protein L24 [Lachnospiraceae bacterium]|nr:50S ribosomal protein L24 [Lachnospiraceae bacterium]